MNQSGDQYNFNDIRKKIYAVRHNFFDNMDVNLINFEKILRSRNFNIEWTKDTDSLFQAIQFFIDKNQINKVCVDSELVFKNFSNCSVVDADVAESSQDDIDLLVLDADYSSCDNGTFVFFDKKTQNCLNQVKNIIIISNINQIYSSINDLTLLTSLKYNHFPSNIRIIKEKPLYTSPSPTIYSNESAVVQSEINVNVIFNLNNLEDLLISEDYISSLYCINCGKCSEICPVFNSSEKNPVSPINLVKQFSLSKSKKFDLFKYTTLCGACNEVCPVGIPITDMILQEMQSYDVENNVVRSKYLYKLLNKRSNINKFNNKFLKFFFNKFFYGKNKMLSSYFNDNSADFFNLTYNPPHENNPNEFEIPDFE